MLKKIIKWSLSILALILLTVGSYVAYLFLDYHRLEDNLALEVTNQTSQDEFAVGQTYSMMSFNIGYGSYPSDYSFFMDGGDEVRARSKKAVEEALAIDKDLITSANPDLILFQEVDLNGDRSQHVNQVDYFTQELTDYSWSFAQNYDSSYLFYPVTDPIGQATSGLLTLSKINFQEATRYQLPIDTDINKFFDLDRAYSVNRYGTNSGADLVVINVHLSAYTKNASIQKAQLEKISQTMESEYAKGNYVIVGGDFNHALNDNARNDLTWMKTFPVDQLPAGFSVIASSNAPTVRNIDQPYNPNTTLTGTIDGFILSDNIIVYKIETLSNDFASSDHHPVLMSIRLQ
ncbi:endonuclease/exonuclease/phosphatase family protein [Streptococcus suis]|uniref:Endonuclease/exonuclease/phosphatase family protein n=1 Tax=Streptococcus suis TaxID=1307 RepID=A0A4T2GIH8_STRSU|nr:endonuclease/exonuclease/phosphatase family protein [Streptococcus suis]MBM7270444.1 endonuclease/exonuclease/phosphatase family protein [Streptococcus suis]TIH98592.1 endonuclease/exonuclease/phosphatase family protein [Streptococcus suis]